MGQRGPKPMPANVHLLHGNASKKSLSQLLDGVHPEVEIPKCPMHLQAEAKKEWKRISIELEQLGLISQIDRAALAAYCAAWAETVHCEKKITDLNAEDPKGEAGLVGITPNGYQQMSVWVQIRNRAYDRMMKFAAEFGMSPSARSRVTVSDNQPSLPGIDPAPDAPKTGWNAV
jgi:P27 family predicted phage terminase small subunit